MQRQTKKPRLDTGIHRQQSLNTKLRKNKTKTQRNRKPEPKYITIIKNKTLGQKTQDHDILTESEQ